MCTIPLISFSVWSHLEVPDLHQQGCRILPLMLLAAYGMLNKSVLPFLFEKIKTMNRVLMRCLELPTSVAQPALIP
ncbi:hypothetical protein R1flu_009395 [Riccia fluitans]|uniref:Uncharacterized protein n=1 Tax=Riccia fluitans TaxID=41844 RepID=A0ABD1Z2R6_9MARC